MYNLFIIRWMTSDRGFAINGTLVIVMFSAFLKYGFRTRYPRGYPTRWILHSPSRQDIGFRETVEGKGMPLHQQEMVCWLYRSGSIGPLFTHFAIPDGQMPTLLASKRVFNCYSDCWMYSSTSRQEEQQASIWQTVQGNKQAGNYAPGCCFPTHLLLH